MTTTAKGVRVELVDGRVVLYPTATEFFASGLNVGIIRVTTEKPKNKFDRYPQGTRKTLAFYRRLSVVSVEDMSVRRVVTKPKPMPKQKAAAKK